LIVPVLLQPAYCTLYASTLLLPLLRALCKMVDPKEAARKKAEESRAAAAAAKMAKHAAGSKKISAFFTAKK
jgi:hypothetical protein